MRSSVIKKSRITFNRDPFAVGPASAAEFLTGIKPTASHAAHGEASISIRRSGDRIQAIEVTCPCGNEIVLECIHASPDVGETA